MKVDKTLSNFIMKPLKRDIFFSRMERLENRLCTLTKMEENNQTNYTGKDLNLLDRVNEKIANETITEKDIFEIERLMFKFL